MKKQTFKEFLMEAPLGDYQTHGDFSKNSSFRDQKDRLMIQHPKSIENVRKKLANSNVVWNLFFVNSPKANKHTEVGKVNIDWVRENLGDDLAKAVAKNDNDSITIIFTNNKGSERKTMTPWIMMHRFGHAVQRSNGMRQERTQYKEASNHLISQISKILELYDVRGFANSDNEMYSGNNVEQVRKNQRTLLYFFYEIATFKSARDRNIRDWFEILNELIAQYVTTGKIKFKDAPQCFSGGARASKIGYCTKEQQEATDALATLSRDMEYMIDNIFSEAIGNIYVM